MKWLPLCLLSGLAICFTGCGSRFPQTVKVTGRVTFDGQPPPTAGIVYFLPVKAAAGFPSRPGTGDFGPNGHFTATTFVPGDGLMPGKYGMHVECWKTPPNMEGKPSQSFVPAKYQSATTSGFEVEITTDARAKEVLLNLVTK